MSRRTRLGWIGIAIVALGAAIAGLGIWYFVASSPRPGGVIDELVVDANTKIVVREERGGPRAFIELHERGEMRWRALVPPYAGKRGVPGITWSDVAISVRVIRGERAEVFAIARRDANKLGGVKLAGEHGPIKRDATGPISLTDHVRSYELVAGEDWHVLTAVDLKLGTALWKRELGPTPIAAGGVDGGTVWVEQAGTKRWFNVFTGTEDRSRERTGHPLPKPL